MSSTVTGQTILALDVGHKRIGVARAHQAVRLASPLLTLQQPERFIEDIVRMCREEDCGLLVIGLPRGLDGQDTAQTAAVQTFAADLQKALATEIVWTDEALTSTAAERELQSRLKPGQAYDKAAVDALAASYILQGYLEGLHG